jgi:hypothetical protein
MFAYGDYDITHHSSASPFALSRVTFKKVFDLGLFLSFRLDT